ncbi:class I SAM-dependent methyltransferase [Faunimonas sp. B44]|uniref:class I SAM-dependent methyltransferase n=1 Tax=Faunimonas sp. B44 TaxID=3461493 RepID=UPI004043E35C
MVDMASGERGRSRLARDLATLRRMLRDRGLRASLDHVWTTALIRAHAVLVDRRRLAWEAVPSAGYRPVAREEVVGPNAGHGFDYAPTPCLVIDWILDALPLDPRSVTLVDMGSGRGRVVLAAAMRPFARCVGVEHSAALHADALANRAAFPADLQRCRRIQFVNGDAADVEIPAGRTVFFFFNPFDDELLGRVLSRIARAEGAETLCVFGAVKGADRLARAYGFTEVRLPPSTRIRLALFSPMRVVAYRGPSRSGLRSGSNIPAAAERRPA